MCSLDMDSDDGASQCADRWPTMPGKHVYDNRSYDRRDDGYSTIRGDRDGNNALFMAWTTLFVGTTLWVLFHFGGLRWVWLLSECICRSSVTLIGWYTFMTRYLASRNMGIFIGIVQVYCPYCWDSTLSR